MHRGNQSYTIGCCSLSQEQYGKRSRHTLLLAAGNENRPAGRGLPVHNPRRVKEVQATGYVQHDATAALIPCHFIRIIPVQCVTQITTLWRRQRAKLHVGTQLR